MKYAFYPSQITSITLTCGACDGGAGYFITTIQVWTALAFAFVCAGIPDQIRDPEMVGVGVLAHCVIQLLVIRLFFIMVGLKSL